MPRSEYKALRGVPRSDYKYLQGVPRSEYKYLQGVPRSEYKYLQGVPRSEYKDLQGVPRSEYKALQGMPRSEYKDLQGVPRSEYKDLQGVPQPRIEAFLWHKKVGWLCWGLTSQSTIFQSCRDGAIASWVINQYFRGVKCLAQGHNTAEVGLEPRTSRSGVRHSTTEPPRSPKRKKVKPKTTECWHTQRRPA